MTSMQNKLTVMGTTSWGITLACLLANKNTPVDIWTRTEIEAIECNAATKAASEANDEKSNDFEESGGELTPAKLVERLPLAEPEKKLANGDDSQNNR